jgi:hypothetical protein
MSSFGNLIDVASVGLIGTKAGFTTSASEQLKQVLDVTAAALQELADDAKLRQTRAVAAAEERRTTKDSRHQIKEILSEQGLKDGRMDALAGNGPISELGHGIESEEGLEKTL